MCVCSNLLRSFTEAHLLRFSCVNRIVQQCNVLVLTVFLFSLLAYVVSRVVACVLDAQVIIDSPQYVNTASMSE